jgi:hypothetical protein
VVRGISGKVISGTGSRFRSAAVYAICIFGVVCGSGPGDTILLKYIPVVLAPEIELKEKVIRNTVDFVFDKCPKDYWVYYDKRARQLVIEFFGVSLKAESPRIKGTSIVGDPSISNHETSLALNGKSAQVRMNMNEQWHYDTWVINGKILRLQLWKPLKPRKLGKSRKPWLIYPIAIAITVSTLVITTIVLSHK